MTLSSTKERKTQEIDYVNKALKSNGYPTKFIFSLKNSITYPRKTPSPEELAYIIFRFEGRIIIIGLNTENLQRKQKQYDSWRNKTC